MNQAARQWKGVFTPVVTPFAPNGDIDKQAWRRLLELLIDEGVAGIIVAGSTGEFYSMDAEEKADAYAFVSEVVAQRVTVLAGTSCIGTRDTLRLTEQALASGIDGALVLPPAFCMPTPREIAAYYRAVAEVGLPIMAYNNPARTGVNLGPALAAELAGIEQVVAFKETQKDIYAFSETFRLLAGSVSLFAGLEPYATAQFSRGAVGLVSTISNVCATDVVALNDALTRGDYQGAQAAQHRIDKLYLLMAKSGMSNFAYVKTAMQILDRPGGQPRLPHLPADASALATIEAGLRDIYPQRFA